jgi:hypothetical protein
MGKMKILRNILAVIAGLIVGGMVNMGIVMISGSIIPPPEGVDLSNIEGMREAMPLMEFRHFIMPFFCPCAWNPYWSLYCIFFSHFTPAQYGSNCWRFLPHWWHCNGGSASLTTLV